MPQSVRSIFPCIKARAVKPACLKILVSARPVKHKSFSHIEFDSQLYWWLFDPKNATPECLPQGLPKTSGLTFNF